MLVHVPYVFVYVAYVFTHARTHVYIYPSLPFDGSDRAYLRGSSVKQISLTKKKKIIIKNKKRSKNTHTPSQVCETKKLFC